MNNFSRKVIVFGGNHHNPLGVIRALGRKKLDVFFLTSVKNSFVAHSKYVTETIFLEKDEDAPQVLLNRFSSELVKPVIVCCGDGFAAIIMNSREMLKNAFIMPYAKVYQKGNIFDKGFQAAVAKECGIEMPQSQVLELSEAKELLKNWNSFPSIVKPLDSLMAFGGKDDIRIVENSEELNAALEKTHSIKIQIQQYIKKKMEFQLIGCSLDEGRIVIIPGFTHILRQPPNTNTGFLKYSSCEKLNYDLRKIKDFMRRVGYSGLFSAEFLRDEKGDYFMEVNFRNDGNAYVVTQAGVNLPYLWVYYCCEGKLPPNEPETIKRETFFMPDLQDIRNVMHGDLSLITFIRDWFKTKAHAVYDLKDLKPFLHQLFLH